MCKEKIEWEKVIAVTNRKLCSNDFLEQIKKIASLGVKALILREKDMEEAEYEKLADQVLGICKEAGTECILHTFIKASINLNCTKVHLPLPILEHLTASEKSYFTLIGVSVHSKEQAENAHRLGADYLTAGHVFLTDCKRGLAARGIDFLQNICHTVEVPVYGIGGICPENMHQVLQTDAAGVCMMSELMRL
ncbi:Regulatory protein tenI [uncultured Roseburia sp.]|uniref:Thiamine phosphate synthase n=1 Tax=Brotonthovivens ammoniilytica TaxID=2981725 RepID=A0ABT2TPP4_9FIRM|nr:thiamine phosphate synthase [Brotonthovivens ammoniilytica]MCU6763577.1 thiamine phosphate synthase [Brotonthovivens ammoniilytica]SCJ25632.1 Regulatory protein tenI [uncultured Roseburia sp.]